MFVLVGFLNETKNNDKQNIFAFFLEAVYVLTLYIMVYALL